MLSETALNTSAQYKIFIWFM